MHDDIASEFGSVDDLPASVDRAAVRRMRVVAGVLDESVPVPGTDRHIGIDPLLGAVPVVGDAVSGVVSLYIVVEAARLGVSYGTLLRMIANVAVDIAVGSLPVVGDAFDALWKSNRRNLRLVIDDLRRDPEQQPTTVDIDVE
jgi:hypothetical protein